MNFLKIFVNSLKITPHFLKFFGIRSLKTVYRLLSVPHDKNRPDNIVNALPGKKFFGYRLNNCPLVRRSILRFVNQNTVYAAIKLIQHPLRHRLIFQQMTRQNNQIFIIHFGILVFIIVITADKLLSQKQNRLG